MADISLGWSTDLDVLRASGSIVTHHDGHIVVRTPDNPGFHWGNFILVTDVDRASDPLRCVDLFRRSLPQARHLAIGLPGDPAPGWTTLDVVIECDDVLASEGPPNPVPLADGYTSRILDDEVDWEASVEAELAEHLRTGGLVDADFERYVRGRMRARARLSYSGQGAYFGAFQAGLLVADLGIVLTDTRARYQSVTTAFGHRRRGLASHLLAEAGRWASTGGAQSWVILAEPGSEARRLYARLGFQGVDQSFQAYSPTFFED